MQYLHIAWCRVNVILFLHLRMTESSGGNAVYVGVVSEVLGLLLMSAGHMLWGAPSTFSSSALS